MKVNQIVGEHKKGVRAMKYTKKTKGTVPVYGPERKDAKLAPVKPTGTVKESEVTLKPMPGAQEVDIDGKAVGTATTPAAATAIADLAKKGEFTPANPDGTTTKPTMETGDDEDDVHPSKHHFHDWLNSEDAPHDDEAGDDKAIIAKALRYLSGRVHPGDMEYHAHHMAHMYHHGDVDEAQSPFPSRNAGTPASADAQSASTGQVQSAVYPSRNVKEGILGFGNKTPEEWAKTSQQMAQLLQFQAKYQGTPYADQIAKRIQILKDRLDMDAGEVAGPGGTPKAVVPPEQFNTNQLKESDNALLNKMLTIAGLR